jgi:hypothetical protein
VRRRLEADLATFCEALEILAGACLMTAFVWVQHHGVVLAVAASGTPGLAETWLEPLCRGTRRAGLALAGVLPGPPQLIPHPVPGGFLLVFGSRPEVRAALLGQLRTAPR